MASTIQVDKIQDTGGNTILQSDGSGTATTTLPVGFGGTGTTSYTPGVTMLDQWVCTDNQSISADTETLITGSWADFATTDSAGNIGSSMTESSGIFTFPETGIYTIDYVMMLQGAGGANDYVTAYLNVTVNDSAYTDALDPAGFFGDAGDRFPFTGHFALDVTDTANVKIKFTVYCADVAAEVGGDGNRMRSGFTVMRIGDT